MKYFLAIDLGASSGRHVIGYKKNNQIVLKEIYRFPTGMDDSLDGLVWNILRLLKEIKEGIRIAFRRYKHIESLSIDTWGVDYVLLNNDKEILPFYAYRNNRNIEASKKVHKIIPFEELYKETGIQFAPFNTLYQLFDDMNKGRLVEATDYLMLPSYFIYKLTRVKTHEYTNESTGALLNPITGLYNYQLIDRLSLPRKLFKNIALPGTVVAPLEENIAKEVGGNTKVILCASHDTASAFEAVNVNSDDIILSSGTWSLLGIKSINPIINKEGMKANYTNEGGVGYIRFLKNIMGMYLANLCRNELKLSLLEISSEVNKSKYKEIFDVNDPSLNAPKKMSEAILKLLKDNPPKNSIDLFASIYHSMAYSYKKAVEELEKITNKTYSNIYIVGGGAKNEYLNKLVKEYTGKNVIPLPIEATCLGNIKIQMKVSEQNEKRN